MSNNEVRRAAVEMLTRREYSSKELFQKLLKKGFNENNILESLDVLKQEGLQSDQRFTESFVRNGVFKGQGPIRIKMDLSEHAIENEVIASTFEAFDDQWAELAKAVWKKKFKNPPKDFKERGKQMRFLQYRGFTSEQIKAAIEQSDEDFYVD